MRLDQDQAMNTLPRGTLPVQLVLPFAREFANRIDDSLLRRSYLWANAILNVGLQYLPARCTHFSAGFVHVNPEAMGLSEWSDQVFGSFLFGGYVLVDASDEEPNQRVFPIYVGDTRIPMVVTAGFFEPHGSPPHPHTGSGACWVKSKAASAMWQHGILTCRHTLANFSLGQSVSLHASTSHATPVSGRLADITACTIDAAIVKVGQNDWPPGLSPLAVHAAPALKDQVQFAGRSSSNSGSILRIFQYAPYPGTLFGQRVIADFAGNPGDSGSLLVDATSGEGVGIYMGTIPDGSGGRDSIYQDLNQAVEYFKLDLYH